MPHDARFFAFLVSSVLTASAGAATAQVVMGSLPAPPGFVAQPGVATYIDIAHPAASDGEVSTATMIWSAAPCVGAAKVKFFRQETQDGFLEFRLFAERGPFDITFVTQTVQLNPTVDVHGGDLVGVASVGGCGTPTFRLNPGSGVAFPGDVTGTVGVPNISEAFFGSAPEVRASSAPISAVIAILPVVISAPGHAGSYFKTRLQLRNPQGVGRITGQIVVHPAFAAAGPSDPSLAYSIAPWETQTIEDLLGAIGITGVGTVDVIPTSEPSDLGPTIQATIYTETLSGGMVAFNEPILAPADLKYPSWLAAGSGGALLGPSDPTTSRMNIGIRTLDAATTVHVVIFDASGIAIATWTKDYPANYFEQLPASALLGGLPLGPNTAFEFRSGNAVIYGVTADNTSQSAVFRLVRPDL